MSSRNRSREKAKARQPVAQRAEFTEKPVLPASPLTDPISSPINTPTGTLWNNPTVIAAIVAGLLGIIGVVLGKANIVSLQFGGTEFDQPTVKMSPRSEICFWHRNSPTGYRLIRRQPDGVWIETQPDGMQFHHIEVGRVERGPWHGVITRREENPKDEPWPVQLFIPDVGAHNVLLYRPSPQASWEFVRVLNGSVQDCPRMSATP